MGSIDSARPRQPDAGTTKQRDRYLFDVAFVAPRTALERDIAEAIREVLEFDRIGVDDDFFELGGDSVLAVSVLARLLAAHGVDVGMRVIFDAPTPAKLAAE